MVDCKLLRIRSFVVGFARIPSALNLENVQAKLEASYELVAV